jgi:hypothetical protein
MKVIVIECQGAGQIDIARADGLQAKGVERTHGKILLIHFLMSCVPTDMGY